MVKTRGKGRECKIQNKKSLATKYLTYWGFPGGSVVKKNPPAIAGESGFDPWVGKIPWRRAWQPTSVSFPGESHGQRSLAGYGHRVAESHRKKVIIF